VKSLQSAIMTGTHIALAAAQPVWLGGVAVYNIYFHPLARVPGPKVAAATSLYKTYYNATDGSKFYLQIEKLHQQFGMLLPLAQALQLTSSGPVIRISPNEIHLSDPENYDKIYRIGTKFSKDPIFYGAFGYGSAAFPTPSNEVHRVRRAALNPLFSRKRVLELENVVQSKVQKVDGRIAQSAKTKAPVDLHHACRAISVDAITDYGFGACYNLLDEEDFGLPFFDAMRKLGPAVWFFQQWPFLQSLALRIPYWLAKRLSANLEAFMKLQMVCISAILSRRC
jgi:cytochrome P450